MKNLTWILVLTLCTAPLAARASSDRAAQVAAATVAAKERLANDLLDEPLGRGVTVGDFFDAMRARDRFEQLIASAEPVGQPRWIDPTTCQVRVDLSAGLVAEMMLTLALADPHLTPIPYVTLENRLRGWQRQSFSATASSITWQRAMDLPPPSASGWVGVSRESRLAALQAARDDAARRFVSQLESTGDPEISALLSDEARRRDLGRWVTEQPLSAVSYRPDRTVEVAMALAPQAMPGVAGRTVPFPRVVTGRSDAVDQVEASRAGAAAEMFVPAAPPPWAAELLDAEATAANGDQPLKTARTAERSAGEALRAKIGQLAWGSGTIADALPTDPALSDAVDRAVAAARVSGVEYRADGSVRVRLSLHGRVLWAEVSTGAATNPLPQQ